MINLFFITYDFSGVRTYTNELVGYLSKQPGITVYRIFPETPVYREYTEIRESDILNIYIPSIQKGRRSLEKYAARCMDLLDPLMRNKEHLIFHLNNAVHVKLGLEARKRFGAKLIYTLHFLPNYFSYIDLDRKNQEELTTTGDALEREITKEADQIICVTHFARKMLIDVFGCATKKVVAIHNGYGKKEGIAPSSGEQQNRLKKKFGFSEQEQIILFVGRLERRKGLKHLFGAFNEVSRRNPRVRLILAGGGYFEETFRDIKSNWGKITITGKISSAGIAKLYKITTIGIIPSIYEQCSYVALEMMQQGLPIIVSGAPGLKELFTDGKDALMVPLHKRTDKLLEPKIHEKELAKTLEMMLKNNVLRQKLGEQARIRWERYYMREQMGEATIKLYRKLVTDNGIENKGIYKKEEGQKVTT